MKRNNLTTAVIAGLVGVAGFAGVSNAVQLSADGLGQALTYSYYTVNANQQTNFSVVNTTDNAKAVKVRFLEAYNSREVLDFNLFLSPWDVWTATIFESGDGGAITTSDNSCTAPYLFGGGGAADGQLPNGANYKNFVRNGYVGADADGGPTNIERTREGHFEMLEMATITPASAAFNWVTHHPVTGALDCAKVQGLLPTSAPVQDFLPPSGGLFGNAAVVNVGDGTMFSYSADAIDGWRNAVRFTESGSVLPHLGEALTAPNAATAYVFMPGGQLITATYAGGARIDAVSAVFAAENVYNEWSAEADIGGASEWIVSFPTKRFYVDDAFVGGAVQAPFTEVFDGKSCDEVGITLYNRDEVPLVPDTCGWSPCPVEEQNSLCYETQVITFNQDGLGASDVLGSGLALNLDASTIGDSGWLNLSFPNARMRPDVDGKQFHGLPVTGHLAQRVINVNAQEGLLASYGGMFRHRVARTCTIEGGEACS